MFCGEPSTIPILDAHSQTGNMGTEHILRVSWNEKPCPDLQSWGEEMAKGTTQLSESRYTGYKYTGAQRRSQGTSGVRGILVSVLTD